MQGLDIAFFGSSLVSSLWNGAATYYRGLTRALASRGHSITFYEPDAYGRQQHRDMDIPSWARVVVYPGDNEGAALRQAERAAAHANVLIKASGIGVYDSLLEQAIPELARSSHVVAFWDVDAPATLERLDQNPGDSFHACIPKFDVIFTYGGGTPVISAYLARGARECVPVYNAVDPDTHHPVPRDPKFAADLSLLANRLPDREQRIEEFFLRAAKLSPSREFLLGGSGWDGKSLGSNVRYVGHVPTDDHNRFNSSCLTVLNVARDSMAKCGFSPATRVFEAAGAAACIITDAWRGIEQFLEPGSEILVADNGEAVANCVNGLTLTQARKIGEAARRRVLAHHTYKLRAAEVEMTLVGCSWEKAVCA